jgi:tripartite-type tricarboxylate transporter receptor subunit TctC
MSRLPALIGALLTIVASASSAQTYPAKAITLIVPTVPGGGTDLAARLLSEPLNKVIGQPVVVENKPGASGNIGTGIVARAQPDGYTLLVQYSGYHVGNPNLFKQIPWDPIKDFAPVGNILLAPHIIVVHPNVPAKDLKELGDLAKAKPGQITYASAGNGSIQHIASEMFAQQVGTKMTHVPYKGAGAAVTDLVAGRVDMFNTTPPSVIGHVKSGKLRALAYTSTKRHPTMPDVPTSAEAKMPNYLVESWFAVFAPAKTPQPVIDKLTGDIKKIVESEEFKKKAEEQGAVAVYMDPKQLDALVKKELDHWGKVIKTGNITAD